MASKLDALAAEYGHLLSSQLESQRAWYDARQAKAVAAAEAGYDPATRAFSERQLQNVANAWLLPTELLRWLGPARCFAPFAM